MNAIITTYYGPRSVRGSRIGARDMDGNKVVVEVEPELNHDDNHRQAALKLCEKMNWHGQLSGPHGLDRRSFVFVWDTGEGMTV